MDRNRPLSCALLCRDKASAEQALSDIDQDDLTAIVFSAACVESTPTRDADILVIQADKGNEFDSCGMA
jgi:hypothetical protein